MLDAGCEPGGAAILLGLSHVQDWALQRKASADEPEKNSGMFELRDTEVGQESTFPARENICVFWGERSVLVSKGFVPLLQQTPGSSESESAGRGFPCPTVSTPQILLPGRSTYPLYLAKSSPMEEAIPISVSCKVSPPPPAFLGSTRGGLGALAGQGAWFQPSCSGLSLGFIPWKSPGSCRRGTHRAPGPAACIGHTPFFQSMFLAADPSPTGDPGPVSGSQGHISKPQTLIDCLMKARLRHLHTGPILLGIICEQWFWVTLELRQACTHQGNTPAPRVPRGSDTASGLSSAFSDIRRSLREASRNQRDRLSW